MAQAEQYWSRIRKSPPLYPPFRMEEYGIKKRKPASLFPPNHQAQPDGLIHSLSKHFIAEDRLEVSKQIDWNSHLILHELLPDQTGLQYLTSRANRENNLRTLQRDIEIGARRANGLWAGLPDNPFTQTLKKGFEEISDNGHNHSRRFERYLKLALLNCEHLPAHMHRRVTAVQLVSRFLEAGQVFQRQWNLDHEDDQSYPQGTHVTGGALFLMTQYKQYAKASGISPEKAKKICWEAAYYILSHDPATNIRKAVHPQDKQNPQMVSGRKLVEAFEQNDLDLRRITPHQLLELHSHLRAQHPSSYKTPHVFEDIYDSELKVLARDNQPLIDAYTILAEESSFDMAARLVLFAHFFDMVYPPDEALVRKFAACSWDRPFWDGSELSEFEKWFPNRKNGVPQDISNFSDVYRTYMEYFSLFDIIDGSPLGDSPYILKMIQDAIFPLTTLFYERGKNLMLNSDDALEEIYRRRLKSIRDKICSRARLTFSQRDQLAGYNNPVLFDSMLKTMLTAKGSDHDWEDYLRSEKVLYAEKRQAMKAESKFLNEDHEVKYSDSDIQNFYTFTAKMSDTLPPLFNTPLSDLDTYILFPSEGRLHPYLKTYDSTGSPKNRGTIFDTNHNE
jgi:hypothetical protein